MVKSKRIIIHSWEGDADSHPLRFNEFPAILGAYSEGHWWRKIFFDGGKSRLAVNRADRPLFMLKSAVFYHTNIGTIIVPAGFIWDNASVPSCLQGVEPAVDDETLYAALLHDWLYATEMFPREVADELFRQMAKKCGAGVWRRNRIWFAVRIGGGEVWEKEHSDLSVWWARDLMAKQEYARLNPWGSYIQMIPYQLLDRPKPTVLHITQKVLRS